MSKVRGRRKRIYKERLEEYRRVEEEERGESTNKDLKSRGRGRRMRKIICKQSTGRGRKRRRKNLKVT